MRVSQTQKAAPAKAGMDEKTTRKHTSFGKLSSEVRVEHTWRTRDALVRHGARLKINPGLDAKTLFEDLQCRYPGRCAKPGVFEN